MFRVMIVAVAVSFLAATVVFAAEANAPAEKPAEKPAPMTVKGTVSVVKDANGVVTAVKLTVAEEKVVYNVTLDKEGMELAKMDGKEVEAQVIKKGADVNVISFKPVEKPKAEEKPPA
jgi:maltose-binding protein MalE